MSIQWKLTPLSEILKSTSRSEKVNRTKEYGLLGIRLDGAGPFLREIKVGSQISANYLSEVKTGDFIYSRLFAWRGAFGVIDSTLSGCYVSSEFPTYEPISKMVDVEFLKLWFRLPATISKVEKECSGSTPLTRNRFKEEFFLRLEIPLPPLEEQHRIVARIEELAARIEEARELRRRAVEETNALSASIARSIFNYKNNSIITIDQLVGRKNLKNGLSVKTTSAESHVRCLRLSALRNGKINCLDSKPIPKNENEIVQYLVKDKDVFIVRGNGSKDLVGRAGIVEETQLGIIFPDLFIRIPLDIRIILPEFFVAWWNSKTMRDIIVEAAKTTSGIWKINQGHIASFSVPLLGLEEQHRIVAYLDGMQSKLDALKRHQADTAAELEALLPAVLERAFRGEL